MSEGLRRDEPELIPGSEATSSALAENRGSLLGGNRYGAAEGGLHDGSGGGIFSIRGATAVRGLKCTTRMYHVLQEMRPNLLILLSGWGTRIRT